MPALSPFGYAFQELTNWSYIEFSKTPSAITMPTSEPATAPTSSAAGCKRLSRSPQRRNFRDLCERRNFWRGGLLDGPLRFQPANLHAEFIFFSCTAANSRFAALTASLSWFRSRISSPKSSRIAAAFFMGLSVGNCKASTRDCEASARQLSASFLTVVMHEARESSSFTRKASAVSAGHDVDTAHPLGGQRSPDCRERMLHVQPGKPSRGSAGFPLRIILSVVGRETTLPAPAKGVDQNSSPCAAGEQNQWFMACGLFLLLAPGLTDRVDIVPVDGEWLAGGSGRLKVAIDRGWTTCILDAPGQLIFSRGRLVDEP
jgi:hypothetical protein